MNEEILINVEAVSNVISHGMNIYLRHWHLVMINKKFLPNYMLIFKQNRFNTVNFFYLHNVYFIHFRNAA